MDDRSISWTRELADFSAPLVMTWAKIGIRGEEEQMTKKEKREGIKRKEKKKVGWGWGDLSQSWESGCVCDGWVCGWSARMFPQIWRVE